MQFDSTFVIWIERKQNNRNRISQNTNTGGSITFHFIFLFSSLFREHVNRTKTTDIDVIWLLLRRKLAQNDLYVCISIMWKVLSFDVKPIWNPQKTTTKSNRTKTQHQHQHSLYISIGQMHRIQMTWKRIQK